MKNNIQQWNVNQTATEVKEKAKAYKEEAEKRFSGLSDANKKKVFAAGALVIAVTFFMFGRSCLGNDDLPPTAPATVKANAMESSVSEKAPVKSENDEIRRIAKTMEHNHNHADKEYWNVLIDGALNMSSSDEEVIMLIASGLTNVYEYHNEDVKDNMQNFFYFMCKYLAGQNTQVRTSFLEKVLNEPPSHIVELAYKAGFF